MKRIASTRSMLLIALAMTLIAVFPGVAAANLFIEETTKTVPAEAPVVTADEFPTAVTGERLELAGKAGKLELLSTGSVSFSCDSVSVNGGTLSGAASELQLTPAYSGCDYKSPLGEVEISQTMQSCKYVLSDFESLEDYYTDAAVEISCNKGHRIRLFIGGCFVDIPAQSLNGSEVANVAAGGEKLLAAGLIDSNVTYTVLTEECQALGLPKVGTYEDGTLESDIGLMNLFLEETTEEVPAEAPVVTADEFPTTVTGERLELGGKAGELELLDTGSGSFRCDSVSVNGGTLSGAASKLELTAAYSGCFVELSSGYKAELSLNMTSCKYVLSDFEPLSTYSDVAGEISCKAGDKITLWVAGGCIVSIPPQPLNVSSEIANITAEGEKLLAAGIIGSNVSYTVSNELLCHTYLGLPKQGTHEDGTLHSDVALRGS